MNYIVFRIFKREKIYQTILFNFSNNIEERINE